MKTLEIVMGFSGILMSIFGLIGIGSFLKNMGNQKRQKKMVKNVQDKYEKIDSNIDTRSDIDVLRKL